MSDPYIGEIRMFGGNFAPRGWALCNGAVLSIAQNDALYALLGTTYGGDGVNTFALPDLRGRLPLHQGQGPGLQPYVIGQTGGAESVTLTGNQLPQHTHTLSASNAPATTSSPQGGFLAQTTNVDMYVSDVGDTPMHPSSISSVAGGSQPHDNMGPYLVVTFIIALEGIFPSQS